MGRHYACAALLGLVFAIGEEVTVNEMELAPIVH